MRSRVPAEWIAAAGAASMLAGCAAQAADFTLGWTGDFAAVASGGLQQGARHMGLVEAGLGSAHGLKSGNTLNWHATVQHTYGGGFSEQWVGDLQTVSNVDAEHGIRLLEAWVELETTGGWSFGVGKYDFNSEFDVIESGGLFLSSSQGIGPDISQSGTAGPSIFPHTAAGLRVQRQTGASGSVRGVVLDADGSSPDRGGPMLALEYQHDTEIWHGVLGTWGYAGTRACIRNPADSAREYGAYASVERHLSDHLSAYLRVGYANPRVEQLGAYFGAGLVDTRGFLPGRDDSVGLAIGVARNGDDYQEAMRAAGTSTERSEYALEATWRIPLGEHFALQPDVQYVIDPSTDPAIGNALVFILRVEAAL